MLEQISLSNYEKFLFLINSLLFQFFLQNIYFPCVEYSFNFVRLIWKVDGILYSLWLIFFVCKENYINIEKLYSSSLRETREFLEEKITW